MRGRKGKGRFTNRPGEARAIRCRCRCRCRVPFRTRPHPKCLANPDVLCVLAIQTPGSVTPRATNYLRVACRAFATRATRLRLSGQIIFADILGDSTIMNKSILILLAGLLASCSTKGNDSPAETGNPNGAPLLRPCYSGEDSECASGVCSANLSRDAFPYSYTPGGGPGHCTLECTSDADCEAARCPDFLRSKLDCEQESIACVTTVDGSYCMQPCKEGESDWSSWKCIDGVPINCERLDESHCEECGCPDGKFCKDGACLPKRQIGEPCESGSECVSPYRCGPTEADPSVKKCLVAAGEPCTADNCEQCSFDGQFCNVRCGSLDLPEHAFCYFSDTLCIGDNSGTYWCARECSAELSGQACAEPLEHLKCKKVSNSNEYVCY